jgi:hypothetical protein
MARWRNGVTIVITENLIFVFYQDCVVDIESRVRAGRSGVRIPAGARDLFLLQNVQTASGANPAFCSLGTGGKVAGSRC